MAAEGLSAAGTGNPGGGDGDTRPAAEWCLNEEVTAVDQGDQGQEKAVDTTAEDSQYEASGTRQQEAVESKGGGIPPGSGEQGADSSQTPPG
jgi:hypothetical protein